MTAVEPGAILFIAPGDRIPVDGIVETGSSDLDRSLVSGESAPGPAMPGTAVQAGLMNFTGPLTIKATAHAENSFLAEMVRMMEAAEGGRARYRRLATAPRRSTHPSCIRSPSSPFLAGCPRPATGTSRSPSLSPSS